MSTANRAEALDEPALQRIEAVGAVIGEGLEIHRALPTRQRRMIGAWCFLDHMGPAHFEHSSGLRVGPHPHIGLQTVTWLTQGEILHRDSLGYRQVIRPGQLNLMTAGRGIAHSEESPLPVAPALHGVQFWIALPDEARAMAPAFEHHAQLPRVFRGDAAMTLLVGEFAGERSPATVHTPMLGVDLAFADEGHALLPLRPDFEHGVFVTAGTLRVDGVEVQTDELLYLPPGRAALNLGAGQAAQAILLGGEPFPSPLLMWWNFVGRSKEELTQACRDWNAGAAYFGEVQGYDGARLEAPLPPWAEAMTR